MKGGDTGAVRNFSTYIALEGLERKGLAAVSPVNDEIRKVISAEMIRNARPGDRVKVLRNGSTTSDGITWDYGKYRIGTVERVRRLSAYIFVYVNPDHLDTNITFTFAPRDLKRI